MYVFVHDSVCVLHDSVCGLNRKLNRKVAIVNRVH